MRPRRNQPARQAALADLPRAQRVAYRTLVQQTASQDPLRLSRPRLMKHFPTLAPELTLDDWQVSAHVLQHILATLDESKEVMKLLESWRIACWRIA